MLNYISILLLFLALPQSASNHFQSNSACIQSNSIAGQVQSFTTSTGETRCFTIYYQLSAGDGWYHDGRTYIGPTGNSSNSHPRLEEFLNEYLIEQNEEIEIYNNSVQSRRLEKKVMTLYVLKNYNLQF